MRTRDLLVAADQLLELGSTAAAAVIVNGHDGDSPEAPGGSRAAGQALTELPQPSRRRLIVGLTRRAPGLPALEIFPGYPLYLGRGGEIDAGFSPLFGLGTEGAPAPTPGATPM